jgi:hypothetical protein
MLQTIKTVNVVGILYRARSGKNYSLSVSVKDDGFYHMHSTLDRENVSNR